MIPAILPSASKIYSILGNNNSLVPLAIKDIANSIGLTAGSYVVGDKLEGKDRFIDEFGTQAIWLFGIPAYKKILDLTLFKSLKYDPKIDVRILKNKDILEKAKKYAVSEEIKNGFEKISKNQKMFKGLAMGKFIASTALTIFTYGALTKYRHKTTEESIKKELLAKAKAKKQEQIKNKFIPYTGTTNSKAFDIIHKSLKGQNNPNFTGGIQDFMFSPVKNLMIVDGSISAERLTKSRNKQDFIGYAIKEGGFWAFMYFAGQKIQKHFEQKSERKYNKSIDLDARVLESNELKQAFADNSLEKSLKALDTSKTDAEIYEYILQNQDDFIVKMAKKSDIISTFKNGEHKGKIDTRAYIDIDEIKGIKSKLEKLHTQYINSELHKSHAKSDSLDLFLNQVKKLKRISVVKNIGACIGALGVLVPAIMVGIRYLDKDNKDFQVKKDIEKKLAFEAKI